MNTQNLCYATTVLSRCCKCPHLMTLYCIMQYMLWTQCKIKGNTFSLYNLHLEKHFLLMARNITDLVPIVFKYIRKANKYINTMHSYVSVCFYDHVVFVLLYQPLHHVCVSLWFPKPSQSKGGFLGNVARDDALMWRKMEGWRHPRDSTRGWWKAPTRDQIFAMWSSFR